MSTATPQEAKKPWYKRSISSKEGAEFPPQAGRYVLEINYGCPFAARAATARHLVGLDNAVALAVTAPGYDLTDPAAAEGSENFQHEGWVFDQSQTPGDPLVSAKDPVFGVHSIREVYELGRPEGGEAFPDDGTVPVLVDSVSKQVVSAESADIVEMFWKECKSLWSEEAKKHIQDNNIDLFPEEGSDLAKEMKQALDVYQSGIVFQVYSVGYARSQKSFEEEQTKLFDNLDKLDKLLETRRFVAGNTLTFADLSLAQALVRFDVAYVPCYRITYRRLSSYKNVYAYTSDVVNLLKMQESAYVPDHIIQIYFGKRNNDKRKERFVPLVAQECLSFDVTGHGRDKIAFK